MASHSTPLRWEVGFHADRRALPDQWIPATVPGAVQLDWAADQKWPPYWKGNNFTQYQWMEDVYWVYRTIVPPIEVPHSQCLWFVCEGIDYQFEIDLNGKTLLAQTGMFTPVQIDLSDAGASAGDSITIRVWPAPKSCLTPVDRVQANRSCKPAVSYGWDFHPRLIPLGIWQNCSLSVRPLHGLRTARTTYRLSADRTSAALTATIDFTEAKNLDRSSHQLVRWILAFENQQVVEQVVSVTPETTAITLEDSIQDPRLWWPHDQGEPCLYTSTIELLDPHGIVIDRKIQRLGFRTVRLLMNDGAWIEPVKFPKSRSVPPMTLEINGRRIFAKGSNWVSPDIFPGTLESSRYRAHLALARQNHMNILRMWGGAPVQKQAFYELADELGIMIWQEFPLACNSYPDDADYLAVLDQESRSILHQLRDHPSIVLWCGGNELFNNWSGMTDQSLALRMLNRNCFELSREIPFLMTSPVMGVGHGHYVFAEGETEAWQIFQGSNHSAYTEFGCGGPALIEVLHEIIPESDLFPPRPGTAWETHHAFGAWLPNSHLYLDVIERYLGPSSSLDEIVEKGMLLQSEGYKGLFEEARRQKPYCSMALNWCLNEPWPTAANNSLMSWPDRPKPSLSAVGQACRPQLASARIRKYLWSEGELFDPELWVLSDSPNTHIAGVIEAWMISDQSERFLLEWKYPSIEPGANARGPRVQVRLPAMKTRRFVLELRVPTSPAMSSKYTLAYRPKEGKAESRTMNF